MTTGKITTFVDNTKTHRKITSYEELPQENGGLQAALVRQAADRRTKLLGSTEIGRQALMHSDPSATVTGLAAEFADKAAPVKKTPDYTKLCDEYKKVLWGKSAGVMASAAEKEQLGKELTLAERFDLIATNPAFESIRVELLGPDSLNYQTPAELPAEMSNTAQFGAGSGSYWWSELKAEVQRRRQRMDAALATTDLGRSAITARNDQK